MRLFPGQKGFRIQDSNTFLASSLSLSFGVMVRAFIRPSGCSGDVVSLTRPARPVDVAVFGAV